VQLMASPETKRKHAQLSPPFNFQSNWLSHRFYFGKSGQNIEIYGDGNYFLPSFNHNH
jgi:hypothetical protein